LLKIGCSRSLVLLTIYWRVSGIPDSIIVITGIDNIIERVWPAYDKKKKYKISDVSLLTVDKDASSKIEGSIADSSPLSGVEETKVAPKKKIQKIFILLYNCSIDKN